uniref:AlNc14C273G9997 protein n=1 Tax=Albugo laibachii Nc14 TaxID=890382 RepID=F0WUI6_9STRA|nr:AlNc14C273G9997 [Albugo laibachii Nc14]|eukprot:CCA25067.1 AlNc14C273G9997 [Albugo laibachii Nc14]
MQKEVCSCIRNISRYRSIFSSDDSYINESSRSPRTPSRFLRVDPKVHCKQLAIKFAVPE